MGAVKEQKPKKMSLLSRKLFSLLLLVALAVSAAASPVEERGFFRLQCYSGCQLCFNHQLHLRRILLEHNLDLRSDLPGPLSQLCWSVSQTNQSSCSCCSETSGEGFLQAAVLLHLPGCQLCFNHQLHLWRILLENHIDLCPDLPRSCRQSGIN